MEEFKELQEVLKVDSPEGIAGKAAERIKELNDSIVKKDQEISELKKKVIVKDEDDDEEVNIETGEENNADKNGNKDKGSVEGNEELKKLREENAKLKKELEQKSKETDSKTDALKKLTGDMQEIQKRTDAIGKKQLRKLFHDGDDGIDELKNKRLHIYNEARGEK